MKNTGFIRDLLVKLLLLVIFVFLLMKLFPMPNLTVFYDKVFNDNIQTMKDAAKDYYTTERMPKEDGKSSKMTLQEMLDQNLIIPFVDKNGDSCDTEKSYVKVTKKGSEYELKVSLTCGKESNYIIDKIGCYNFCQDGTCSEAKKEVSTKTDDKGNVTVVNPNGYYVTEYEFVKNLKSETWKTGDWTTEKLTENENRKLVDSKTEYTGQKKVTTGTKLYEQVKYGYKDEYTYDTEWRDTTVTKENAELWKQRTLYTGQKKVTTGSKLYEEVKYGTKTEYTYDENWRNTTVTDSNAELWQERTLYTGQKKVESGQTLYEHVKYGTVNNWTYDTDWTTEVKTTNDNLRLWQERTLYTGQKKIETETTNYKHVKYGDTYSWTETGWTTANRAETDDIKVIGKRYTVTKDLYDYTCENYTTDTTWYTSKPADTDTRHYDSTPVSTNTTTTWNVLYNSYKSYTTMATYVGDRKYEFLYSEETLCTSNCNGQSKVKVYYYRVYTKSIGTTYRYRYCTPTKKFNKTDTQVVTDLQTYLNNGYTLTKTEYNYNVRTTTRGIIDTVWTESATAPAGYTYTGKTSKVIKISYEQLNKWVTNKDKLGDYTYNITTVKQYKYGYNNPTKYVEDYKWTSSKTSPEGYTYTGNSKTNVATTYEQLNKWVTSKDKLGEYTYNINTVKQYKYRFKKTSRYIEDTKWITKNKADEGYELTGKTKETSSTTYVDLGKWVTSKEDLNEYTYNIKTKKQYKYRYKTTTKYIEDTKWTTENVADEGYILTGKTKETTKTTYLDLGKWVDSKSDLGEYTYNIKTRTLYRYKTRTISTSQKYIWAKENPGDGYEPTGRSRRTFIPTRGNVQK